jgi:hypothetical protein
MTNESDHKQSLIKALIAAKAEFGPIAKDKTNTYTNSKYSSLDAVLGAVEPALAKQGMVITHHAAGDLFITTLHCENGESLTSSLPLPSFSDPQKLGSYLTYCRRYAITGLLSVCSDEDDDANSAKPAKTDTKPAKTDTKPRNQRPDPPPYKPPSTPRVTTAKTECQKEVVALIREIGWTKQQSQDWAAKFSSKPKEEWTTDDWASAREKLIHKLDEVIQQRDQEEDLHYPTDDIP